MNEIVETRCCIAGGGPAGMMLGFLLARAGVHAVVLEKHADFLRDFRGDTIHPSTLEVMYELGLVDEFLKRPHQEIRELAGWIGNERVKLADFTHLPTHCKFLALMPQWDFLNFFAEQGRRYPTFQVRMQAEVTDLVYENGDEKGRVIGVRAKTPEGNLEVRCGLTVGADGRSSVVRKCAGLEGIHLGAPMDVMWTKVSRKTGDPGQTFGRVASGRMLALIDREEYWQLAYVIPKGGAEEVRQKGMAWFREDLVTLLPFLRDRVEELQEWEQVKLLTVMVDRLRKWSRPGLLCIGDAAHAMSPIGGVGINLAIQDAVASANLLGPKLVRGIPSDEEVQAVQRRREFPTRATQRMQLMVQNNVVRRVLDSKKPLKVPWVVKVMDSVPWLRRIPARTIGMGFRPEHVRFGGS